MSENKNICPHCTHLIVLSDLPEKIDLFVSAGNQIKLIYCPNCDEQIKIILRVSICLQEILG